MSLKWNLTKILLLIIFSIGLAHAKGGTGFLENAPSRYVVQDGDTLWEIACKFLHNPQDWQEIWHANPEIQNPNLIFPGDTIEFVTLEGKRKLHVKRGHSTQVLNKRTGVIKLHPRVRELPADKAIPTIPLNVIGPFLNESRVITSQQAQHCPRIVALDEDHIVVGAGDLFYVKGLAATNVEDIYMVFRPSKTYFNPKTKEKLGIEGRMLAKAQLDKPGNPARLVLRQSYQEVKVGDRITGMRKEAISPVFTPKAPKGNGKGQIISVFGGISQIGQYQVLVITGGQDQQREQGDVLAIYQIHKDLPARLSTNKSKEYRFPPLNIGTCVVFRVFDKVSYVLVMDATRPIYLLDEVGRT